MPAAITTRSAELEGARILIVDGDPASRHQLGAILRGAGCICAEASSAAEAHECCAAVRPDLVFVAMTPPDIGGADLGAQLRREPGNAGAALVKITARAEMSRETDADEAFEGDDADFVSKPFRPGEVLARVRLHRRAQALSAQLAATNSAKLRFLGMAAHDLRGPLGSIRGIADCLGEGAVGPLSPDQNELVGMIRTTSDQMLALVSDLLDVATIESGELRLTPGPCPVFELLGESVGLANLEASKKKTHVAFNPSGAGPLLNLDAPKMKQVFANLLSNAVKYSPPGSTVSVLVLPDAAGETCAISVRDQGGGIPSHERGKLFTDFGRLSVRPTGGESSTGLGLVICRKIVEAHGGTISAENLAPRGCEFRVTLPAHV